PHEQEQTLGRNGIDHRACQAEYGEIEQVGDNGAPDTVEMVLQTTFHLAAKQRADADPVDGTEAPWLRQQPDLDRRRGMGGLGHGRSLYPIRNRRQLSQNRPALAPIRTIIPTISEPSAWPMNP